ncbi:hypothetical protein BE04_45845 [Sorangium cellulosum]|uniref:Uncharacterized protein n=1 Tax=Sorangium cellulosum TaxID=56 RepID=A0A150PCE6_SORCE|nr:hypothetical protein BE04_45845 [Sorangium cellulosum]
MVVPGVGTAHVEPLERLQIILDEVEDALAAMPWSSEGPVGLALNFVAWSKLNGSSLLGATGAHVKYDPHTCVWRSFPCPRANVAVHSFIARMPRGMRSLST